MGLRPDRPAGFRHWVLSLSEVRYSRFRCKRRQWRSRSCRRLLQQDSTGPESAGRRSKFATPSKLYIGQRLTPDAAFADGELSCSIDGVTVIDRIFESEAEGTFILAQWKVLATTFFITERTAAKKLCAALRKLTTNDGSPVVSQIMALERELASRDAEIAGQERGCMRSSTGPLASAPKKSKWRRKDSFFSAHIAGSRRSQLPFLDPAFSSATGGNASITRSGGKITMTSVPSRSLDFRVKDPPWSSTRPFTIGRPKPEPSSAFFCASAPRPNEDMMIGISSSGIPGPLSRTATY